MPGRLWKNVRIARGWSMVPPSQRAEAHVAGDLGSGGAPMAGHRLTPVFTREGGPGPGPLGQRTTLR